MRRYCFFCVVSEDAPAELLGELLLGDEEAPPLEDWSLEELGEALLGELDIEPEDDGELLVPADEEPDDEGDEGEVAEPVAERLELDPVLEPVPGLSQPYNAPTARAIGRTATAVFFNSFM